MMESLRKPAKFLFTFLCFIALAAVSIYQVEKFIRNKDSSTISFKRFNKEQYPTYTICFEDNDNVGGIYKTLFIHGPEIKVYFDGKMLRLDKSNMSHEEWQVKWFPNATDLDISNLGRTKELLFLPIMINYQSLEHLVYLILFNETYLIPPAEYKALLKGIAKRSFEVHMDPNYVRNSRLDSFNVTSSMGVIKEIDFGDATRKWKISWKSFPQRPQAI